jgi:hypothetical protein
MILFKNIQPRVDAADTAAAKLLKVKDLYAQIQSSGHSRVPIFTGQVALYVVHEPDIDKYAQQNGVKADSLTDADTLEKLATDAALGAAISSIVAVPPTASLSDARARLKTVAESKDVFVTHDGQITGQVLGWITNSDLARAD